MLCALLGGFALKDERSTIDVLTNSVRNHRRERRGED